MMAYTQIRFLVIAAALVIIIVGINQAQSVLPSFLDNPKITDKIKKVIFTQPSLSREDEGRGANNFTGQEGNSLNALATGGTGFIGIHLTEALIPKGMQARCLPRKTSDLKWLTSLSIEFVRGDCNDKTSETTTCRRHRKADWL